MSKINQIEKIYLGKNNYGSSATSTNSKDKLATLLQKKTYLPSHLLLNKTINKNNTPLLDNSKASLKKKKIISLLAVEMTILPKTENNSSIYKGFSQPLENKENKKKVSSDINPTNTKSQTRITENIFQARDTHLKKFSVINEKYEAYNKKISAYLKDKEGKTQLENLIFFKEVDITSLENTTDSSISRLELPGVNKLEGDSSNNTRKDTSNEAYNQDTKSISYILGPKGKRDVYTLTTKIQKFLHIFNKLYLQNTPSESKLVLTLKKYFSPSTTAINLKKDKTQKFLFPLLLTKTKSESIYRPFLKKKINAISIRKDTSLLVKPESEIRGQELLKLIEQGIILINNLRNLINKKKMVVNYIASLPHKEVILNMNNGSLPLSNFKPNNSIISTDSINKALNFEKPKLASLPFSLRYLASNNLNNTSASSIINNQASNKENLIQKPVLSHYLKEMSVYNMRNKGILIFYFILVGFNFNTNLNKIFSSGKNIYKLFSASFKSMYCLISKPVFVTTSDKIIVQLFYYLFIPNVLKLKKFFNPAIGSDLNGITKKKSNLNRKAIVQVNNIEFLEKKSKTLKKFLNSSLGLLDQRVQQNELVNPSSTATATLTSSMDSVPHISPSSSDSEESSRQLLLLGRTSRKLKIRNKENFLRKIKIKKQYYKFRKIKISVRVKLRKLSNISLAKVYPNKFKYLSLIINNIFNKPVEFDLVRLHYPYSDSNILVNLLGVMINKIKLRLILRRFFEKAIIKNINNLKDQRGVLIPAFLSGLTIRVAGRLLTHKVVPRQTVKSTSRGASAQGRINFRDVATYTNKNKRGAFSITINSGQNFF